MAEKSEPVGTGLRAMGMSASWYFWLGADAERDAEPAREGMADAPTAANSDKSKP